MRGLARRVALARGWPRWGAAFGAGAAGALAMPPLGLLPALVLALAPVVWLIDGAVAGRPALARQTIWSVMATGWWWGFGYFVAGLWWLGAAFLVEADQFAWALPFGVLGLPALLAVFPAAGFALAGALWSPGPLRLFALGFGLSASEWLRGHLFTGFPWNSLGMSLGQHLWLMQGAAVLGLYGLTLLAVLIGAAPATLATGKTRAARLAPSLLAALALLGLGAFGALRLGEPLPAVADVRLRIMQPNLPQDAKFSPQNREAIMRHYLALSDAHSAQGQGLADVTHLVWPESAFPFLLHRDPRALAQIAGLLPPGVTLITGAARMDDPLPGEAVGGFFNAIHVVEHDGTIAGTYDKVHLVPFGEYVPDLLHSLIHGLGLRQFVAIPGGFEPGLAREPLLIRGLPPAAATICYEAIFPGAILPKGPRPGVILNVTNDAWFGRTPGPYQHLAQARLRAVEEGLPLVRAANSGVSAVIDPFGRVVQSLPLGVEGILDAALPPAVAPPLYARAGDIPFGMLLLACLALVLPARRAGPGTVPAPTAP